MYFYSKTTGGFYISAIHGDAIPGDAVEITQAQHRALMVGQSMGKRIIADASGAPVLLDRVMPTLNEVKAGLMAGVDAYISDIYSRFTRFETEYVQREAAARAFKAGGYQGDAGVWVMSFATNAGMTATVAADLIISQADGMRAALQALGALRMGKYGISAAATAEAAQAVHDSIIGQAAAIASAL